MKRAISITILLAAVISLAAKTPVIGISAQPNGSKHSANASYVQAVRNAGGTALLLPYSTDEKQINAMLDHIDGLIMTGGVDFAPALYGEEPDAKLGEVDSLRDTCDLMLVRAAARRGIPILGICRGEQLLSVAFGGSLWQDIPSMFPESNIQHRGIPLSQPCHDISIRKGSFLYNIWKTDKFDVNSAHHQCVKRVPQGFEVVATTSDGVVEAIQRTGRLASEFKDGGGLIVGVQFHPEAIASKDASSPFCDLFRWFVKQSSSKKKHKKSDYFGAE